MIVSIFKKRTSYLYKFIVGLLQEDDVNDIKFWDKLR